MLRRLAFKKSFKSFNKGAVFKALQVEISIDRLIGFLLFQIKTWWHFEKVFLSPIWFATMFFAAFHQNAIYLASVAS